MENAEILDIWKAYDKKLETQLFINLKTAEDLTKLKIKSFLHDMRPVKIVTILAGVLWVLFVDTLLIRFFHAASPFFLISALIQVLLTKLAIGFYLYQLALIRQVDINQPILKAQRKIAELQSSTIWVTRLLFLQLPVWTTFHLNTAMFGNGETLLWAIQITVTLSFTFIGVWLFCNIRYQNRHKRWFRWIFSGKEWTPLMKSLDLLHHLDEETANATGGDK